MSSKGESALKGAEQLGTRERLMDAAEVVIGDVGVEAASLRSINVAAGCNIAAIHYHFGSKEALVKATLARRMNLLGEHRHRLFDELDDDNPALRDVAHAAISPFVEFVYGEGQTSYLKFLIMLQKAGGAWSAAMMDAFLPQAERVDALYAAALPHVAVPTIRARRMVAAHTIWEILADVSSFFGRQPPKDVAVDAIVEIVVSILSLPNWDDGS